MRTPHARPREHIRRSSATLCRGGANDEKVQEPRTCRRPSPTETADKKGHRLAGPTGRRRRSFIRAATVKRTATRRAVRCFTVLARSMRRDGMLSTLAWPAAPGARLASYVLYSARWCWHHEFTTRAVVADRAGAAVLSAARVTSKHYWTVRCVLAFVLSTVVALF